MHNPNDLRCKSPAAGRATARKRLPFDDTQRRSSASSRITMDQLKGDKLRLACSVVHERYKACVKSCMTEQVLARGDWDAPTRVCGHLFADLTEFCGEFLRSGELQAETRKRP